MLVDNATGLLRSARPAFLLLSLVCAGLGVATALRATSSVAMLDVVLVMAGALLAHISVNLLNEYHDFRSGLDARTTRTAFSGGSGALVERPGAAQVVRLVAVMALLLTLTIGGYFLYLQGLALLPIGVIGALIIISYTPWIIHHPILCLLAPGAGFGPLMVVGTYVALTGEYSLRVLLVSLVPFFLVNNLLLFNQYPDIEADRSVGRRHFPIAYGKRSSNVVFAIFLLGACLTILTMIWLDYLPVIGLFALLPLVAGVVALAGMTRNSGPDQSVSFYLGMNVVATLLTPLLLAMTLLVPLS